MALTKGNEAAIKVRDLTKSYKSLKVLKGISFNVKRGSIFALLGSNGAGKTTAINILSTLLIPNSGSAEIEGFDVVKYPNNVRSKISLTGQYSTVDELLTTRENLTMIGNLLHLSDVKPQVIDLLTRFDLLEDADRPVSTFSGGMKRRLDIAMSLLGNPSVIFLDEPTTGLDPKSRISTWEMIKELASVGITIFLTTQYLEEAEYLADKIAILHDGKIVIEGSVAEIKQIIPTVFVILNLNNKTDTYKALNIFSNKNAQVIEGTNNVKVESNGTIPDISDILKKIEMNNIAADSFEQKKPTLESVFLKIVNNEVE